MEHWENLYLEDLSEEIDGKVFKEEWRPIKGFEKEYLISSFGRVKSFVFNKGVDSGKGKILRQHSTNNGYMFVCLYKKKFKKQFTIHRLVGIHFLENPDNKPEVNHLFGVKTDNRVHQLEWATVSRNRKHAYDIGANKGSHNMLGKFGKLHHNSKVVIQLSLTGQQIASFHGTREAERATGINQSRISFAARFGKPLRGYKWQYK